jgi:hypothetical protein
MSDVFIWIYSGGGGEAQRLWNILKGGASYKS